MRDEEKPGTWTEDERQIMQLKFVARAWEGKDPAWAAHIREGLELVEEMRAEAGLAPSCSRCSKPSKVGEMGWWTEIDGKDVCEGCLTAEEIESDDVWGEEAGNA